MAAVYPTIIPAKIGISFKRPLANKLTIIAVTSAIMASSQSSFAISTPVPASDRPISIITGPITTGGKRRLISLIPCHLTRALIKK